MVLSFVHDVGPGYLQFCAALSGSRAHQAGIQIFNSSLAQEVSAEYLAKGVFLALKYQLKLKCVADAWRSTWRMTMPPPWSPPDEI
jgi:hypothetical protein